MTLDDPWGHTSFYCSDEYDEVNQRAATVYLDTDVIARFKAAETSLEIEKQQLDRFTPQLIITEDMPILPGICSSAPTSR